MSVTLGACRACQATIDWYRYPELAGAFEAVEDLYVPSDGSDLGEPEPVVFPDEFAVQLVSFGFCCVIVTCSKLSAMSQISSVRQTPSLVQMRICRACR